MPDFRMALLCTLAVVFAAEPGRATGPSGTLYVTGVPGGDGLVRLGLLQGSSQTWTTTLDTNDFCIAVAGGDVRTMGYSGGNSGSRFSLSGLPISGGPYTNGANGSRLTDGTSDGVYNYSVDGATGDVLRFDRTWRNRIALFNVSGSLPDPAGISMNPADGSFWLSSSTTGRVEHRDGSGSLLGSFTAQGWSSGLAFDPLDQTVWVGSNTFLLYQYSQAGDALGSLVTRLRRLPVGMEFETSQLPSPSSISMLVLWTASVLRRHRVRGEAICRRSNCLPVPLDHSRSAVKGAAS
ncbi:MAG: hypothetical protein JSR77_05635 [Planctomycetes bacterium]|nr:hypothetical protein [Planctomycetota bacterium]